MPMNAVLDPIVSEFQTEEQAASYDLWFRAKVQQALDSKAARIPHDQVMAEMGSIIVATEQRYTQNKPDAPNRLDG